MNQCDIKAILCAWVQLHLLSKAGVFTEVCVFISNYLVFLSSQTTIQMMFVISCVQLGGEAVFLFKHYSSCG